MRLCLKWRECRLVAGESPDVEVDPTSDVDPQQLAAAVAYVGPSVQAGDQESGVSEERPGVLGLPADLVAESEVAGPAVRRLPRSAG